MVATTRSALPVLLAIAVAAPCGAQVKVELTPLAGYLRPLANLIGPVFPHYGFDQAFRQRTGIAQGGRVTAWITDRLAIDGSLGYSSSGASLSEPPPLCLADTLCAGVITSHTVGHVLMASVRLSFTIAPHSVRASHQRAYAELFRKPTTMPMATP